MRGVAGVRTRSAALFVCALALLTGRPARAQQRPATPTAPVSQGGVDGETVVEVDNSIGNAPTASRPVGDETVVEVPPERQGYYLLARGGPAFSAGSYALDVGAGGGWLSFSAGKHTRSGAQIGGALGARLHGGGRGYLQFVGDVSALARYIGLPASRWHPVGDLSVGLYLFHLRGDDFAPEPVRFGFGASGGVGFAYDLSDAVSLDVTARVEVMINGARTTSATRSYPFDLWLTLGAGISVTP